MESTLIELPASDDPVVSVLVLLTREASLAERCLRAVSVGHERDVPTEVVLVLNTPDDETRALVHERTRGARVIESTVNTGTGVGWNLGFAAARGRWVALLHEDSEPEPGWLGPVLETAEAHPRAAVVGSRLLWSDSERAGTLCNRGDVIFRDGMPGYLIDEALEGEDPHVCDYCWSAAALIERAAWESVGGFDERYFPAMRHEMDLCIALWRSGRTVMCDPRSTVHHLGNAMVRDGGGPFAGHDFRWFLGERSRTRLVEKWGDALETFAWRDPELRFEPPTVAELREGLARTEARAAAGPLVLDSVPRSVRMLSAPDGRWPEAVDPAMERRLLDAQLEVQRDFSGQLLASFMELRDRIDGLTTRAETLDRVLAGPWWRLRRRLDPAVRLARRISRRPA